MVLSPGDVIVADLPGAVKGKRRPAVVLSTSVYQANRPDVIAGIITANLASATAPSDCRIVDWQAAGLARPSVFLTYVVTPERADCRLIGHLSAADWKMVQACVRSALELS
jgi:mRNA interferase MazF